jgi:hypothetical protein
VLAAALPNDTVAPLTKFEPVIVTIVPPAVLPVFGDTGLVVANCGGGAAAGGMAVTDFCAKNPPEKADTEATSNCTVPAVAGGAVQLTFQVQVLAPEQNLVVWPI